MRHFLLSVIASTALLTQGAFAQTAPISRTIPLTFTGVVTDDVTNTIKIRQPDGSFANYTGPVPNYPYVNGEQITLSFNATVPTQAFYAAGGPYRGELAADGIYRIGLSNPINSGGTAPGGVGNAGGFDVSGPIQPAPNSGQPTNVGGITVVYNAISDNYSLEFGPNGWSVGRLDGPGLQYDPATNSATVTSQTCQGSNCSDGGFGISSSLIPSGSSANAGISNVPIFAAPGATPQGILGFFSLLFSGSWNLPTFNSGGSTQVPEPGMIFLFGTGAATLLIRRRRQRSKA